jgi:hypothetical protein
MHLAVPVSPAAAREADLMTRLRELGQRGVDLGQFPVLRLLGHLLAALAPGATSIHAQHGVFGAPSDPETMSGDLPTGI